MATLNDSPPSYDDIEKQDQGGHPVVQGGQPVVQGGQPVVQGGQPVVQGGHIIIVQQPAGSVFAHKMVQPVIFHTPYPKNLVCSGCEQSVVTYTREVFGKKTGWGMAAFFCGLGLFGFWIPLVASSFKDVEHRCPRCNSFLGTFRPSSSGAQIAFGILTALSIAIIVLYVYAHSQ